MSTNGDKFMLHQCDDVLKKVGCLLEKETAILVVGGYCMLSLGVRNSTSDIDFIPMDLNFVVPREYDKMLNHDVLNIAELDLNFVRLLPFVKSRIRFGKLVVLQANESLLLALKYIAVTSRSANRDKVDLLALDKIADRREAYKALKIISKTVPTWRDFHDELNSELYIAKFEVDLMGKIKRGV